VIAGLIRWSIRNRLLVVLAAALLSVWGVYSVHTMPLDAIPDLSDVQVIIRTSYPGQAPQVVEDQITYPLSTAMLAVPGAVAVRGYSFFGDSYVYVIFSDDTDLYWARSRVLEYLSQVSEQLPKGAQPKLGPDATGVGWIYQYALLDRSGRHDLAELRTLQDWFLKYELQTVPGIAEVATVGGMVKQYQIVIDPDRLRGYYLTLANVKRSIQESSMEIGGSALELAEAEYMVRFKGYVKNTEDIGLTSVPTIRRRLSISSVLLDDVVRTIQIGPAMRRGIADLDGEGEVVGGIVVMRSGENALATIDAVKEKLDELRHSLPDSVETGGLCRHAPARHQCQHHVPWGYRDCDWRHGRCHHCHDRERSQACRTHTLRWRKPLAGNPERRGRSWLAAVLLAPHYHSQLCTRICAGSTGGKAVYATGIHQDLCHGGGGRSFGEAGSGTDGLPDTGPYSR
jgi:Cu(I)/Ag(I) efflux system membrane protein CusA/SilA